jgi:glutaminyl-tRNA synthetase
MRDPAIYRILKRLHHRTGEEWCIYPMYDYAHCLEDSIEGITHSLCSMEFEDHRPLYDWFLETLDIFHPRQIEFARLNLTYTVMSKRALRRLVESSAVSGWDDPRMPSLSALRRRGVTPESIRSFISRIGLAKRDSMVDMALFEHFIREDLNMTSPRIMGVLDPLRVVIENYPEGETEEFDFVTNPEDESTGTRKIPFSRVLYIERDDFRENPPGKYHRLAPGREVRLRYAYLITCTGVVYDENGEVNEILCTFDPETRGGNAPDGRKVRGTIHWVSAPHSLEAEVRLYDRLFTIEHPPVDEHMEQFLNPHSLEILSGCRVEASLASAVQGERFQFERKGYFCVDRDSLPGKPVFNRTIPLRDTWAKIEAKSTDGNPNSSG